MCRSILAIAIILTAAPLRAAAQTTRPAAPATAPTLTPIAHFLESGFCPASGGHYYQGQWGLPMTNVCAGVF